MKNLFCILFLIVLTYTQISPTCFQDEYEVSGTTLGKQVTMDYATSSIAPMFNISGSDSWVSTLSLVYNIPTMFFEGNHDQVGGADFAITFSNRVNHTTHQGCFTTRTDNYDYCPSAMGDTGYPWSYDNSSDECNTVLTGNIIWEDVFMQEVFDPEKIYVDKQTVTESGTDADTGNPWTYEYEAWDVYLMSLVETWAYMTESFDPSDTSFLTITGTQTNQYYVAFRVRFPAEITLHQTDGEQKYEGGSLVSYPNIYKQETSFTTQIAFWYAIMDQTMGEVTWDGTATATKITIKTSLSYPYAFRSYIPGYNDGTNGSAIIKPADGNPNSIQFLSNWNGMICNFTTPDQYCEQEWELEIQPAECDISGLYEAEFWAMCHTFDLNQGYGCGVDILADDGNKTSNAYSGLLRFSIQAQDFCPTVIDSIYVNGNLTIYDADTFTGAGIDTVDFNQYVYLRAQYWSWSQKFVDGVPDTASGTNLDDSLVDHVRVVKIEMEVKMDHLPLQTDPVDVSHGGITITETAGGVYHYKVVLCEVGAETSYPYTQNTTDDCFLAENLNFYSKTELDVQSQMVDGVTDPDEIRFSLLLHEEVIPNDFGQYEGGIGIEIIFTVAAEIFYTEVDGIQSVRRRELRTEPQRRTLQAPPNPFQQQYHMTQAQLAVVSENDAKPYCNFGGDVERAGFKIDVLMPRDELPGISDGNEEASSSVWTLYEYLQSTDIDEIAIFRIELCTLLDECDEIYPSVGFGADSFKDYKYVRYFIEFPREAGEMFQNDLYHNSPALYSSNFLKGYQIRDADVSPCNPELQAFFDANRGKVLMTVEDSFPALCTFLAAFAVFFQY